MALRAAIQSFDSKIEEAVVDETLMRKLIPDLEKPSGSINKFHLMLSEKDVKVDDNLFGLRNVNRIVAKMAHPIDKTDSLVALLKAEGLDALYLSDEWGKLHREILVRYKTFLERLVKALIP